MYNRVKMFEITEAHLKLLRAANVGWDNCEFGAPAIDCKRPYGNSSVIEDMREILGCPHECAENLEAIHNETKTALQIVLSVGYFKCGTYTAEEYSKVWQEAA